MRTHEYLLSTSRGRFWGKTARKAFSTFLSENPDLDAEEIASFRIAFNQAWKDLKTGRRATYTFKGYGERELRLSKAMR
jgi:hypothetical protein